MPRPALRHIAHGGPIRRLPLPDALAALRLGMASVAVPQAVKSLDMTYYPTKDTGAKHFINRFAPQIAYANPTLPFTIRRLGPTQSKSPHHKSKSTTSNDSTSTATSTPTTSEPTVSAAESEASEDDVAEPAERPQRPPQQITIDYLDGSKRTIPFRRKDGQTILRELLTTLELPIPLRLTTSETLEAAGVPGEDVEAEEEEEEEPLLVESGEMMSGQEAEDIHREQAA